MRDLFVTYEIAVKVKELGFDDPCLMCFYHENNFGQPKDKLYLPSSFGKSKNSLPESDNPWLTAPLWQQVIEWLMVYHNIEILVTNSYNAIDLWEYNVRNLIFSYDMRLDYDSSYDKLFYLTYNEAREKAILKALELI